MRDIIRIQMMGEFVIYINERQADHMVNKSRKGLALIEYLIVGHGQPVSNQRLLSAFWGDERVTNPENALKTCARCLARFRRIWAAASSPIAAHTTGNACQR